MLEELVRRYTDLMALVKKPDVTMAELRARFGKDGESD